VKDGAGQLTLGNSGWNTFAGNVSILGGTLQLSGSPDRLPTNSVVTLADVAGAALDLNNLDQTLASLTGGGGSGGNVSLGAGTLTITDDGGDLAGIISGSGRIVKTNAGTQVLSGANLYSGGTLVAGGRLAVANASGSGTGSGLVQVETNATFAIGNGDSAGSISAVTITNNGTVALNRNDDFTLLNFITGDGGVRKENANNTVTLPISNTYTGVTTVAAGALRISNAGALGTTDGETSIQNDSTARLELTGGIALLEQLRVAQKQSAAGTVPCVVNVSGSNTLAGPIIGVAGGSFWTFEVAADKLTVSGSFTNANTSNTRVLRLRGGAGIGDWQSSIANQAGNLSLTGVTKEDTGIWILSGASSYTGPTVVSDGILLVNGVLSGGSVTVNGGTLGGNGSISVPVTVNALGTLSPGNSLGELSVFSSLTLSGNTVMELSKSGATVTNDQVSVLTTLTLGGNLDVTLSGTVSGGEVFPLFTAGTFQGAFDTLNLPTLPGGLTWIPDNLAVDGTLAVSGGAPKLNVLQSGNQLTFSWTGTGFKLQAQTNSINVGLASNWSDYPGGSTSGVTSTIDPAQPTVFFRLISQ